MTDKEAEYIITRVLHLRKEGVNDNDKMIEELQKEGFEGTDESFQWIFEMIDTAAFRASIISSGSKYPNSNIEIEDDPILRNAFRMYWVELKGEDHYRKNYRNKISTSKAWWEFWKK